MKRNLLCVGPDAGCYVDQTYNMVFQGQVVEGLPTLLSWLSSDFSCYHVRHQDILLEDGQLKISSIPAPNEFLETCSALLFRGYKWAPRSERTRLALIEKLLLDHHPHLALPNLVRDRELFDQKSLFYSTLFDRYKGTAGAFRAIPKHILIREPSDLDECDTRLGLPFLLRVDGLSSGRGLFLIRDKAEAYRIYARIHDGSPSWFITDARPLSVGKLANGVVEALRGIVNRGGRMPVPQVLATEYVDAYHQDIGVFLNGAAYFFGENLFYAHPRLSRRHWNIHNYTADDINLPQKHYRLAVDRFFVAMNEHVDELKAIRSCLGAASLRLDLIITHGGRVVVCEPALKNGVAKGAWNNIIPVMKRVGYTIQRVQESIGAKALSPSDILFNAHQPEEA